MSAEKKVSYQTNNTYTTLNEFGPETKNVWVVCHGLGYLSRFFVKHFKHLDSRENYIIAPQAQSKYYLNDKYTHVGASWLTKENTQAEIENVMTYLDKVYEAEQLQNAPSLILFGFSQGVSVLTRWVARNKTTCSKIILYAGKIPAELQSEDFSFLKDTEVFQVYGKNDPFLNSENLNEQKIKAEELFGDKLKVISFNGGHEIKTEVIDNLFQQKP